jgi:hypothetical protein
MFFESAASQTLVKTYKTARAYRGEMEKGNVHSEDATTLQHGGSASSYPDPETSSLDFREPLSSMDPLVQDIRGSVHPSNPCTWVTIEEITDNADLLESSGAPYDNKVIFKEVDLPKEDPASVDDPPRVTDWQSTVRGTVASLWKTRFQK